LVVVGVAQYLMVILLEILVGQVVVLVTLPLVEWEQVIKGMLVVSRMILVTAAAAVAEQGLLGQTDQEIMVVMVVLVFPHQ
tara:strand:+ start:315 stop:557 length:243 start_codon:yes stop_codon:yes gene_type:complete